MGEYQMTPNLEASGTIRPFRCVVVSGENTGAEASAEDAFCVGITTGSTKQFDSANHAESGDPISLQTGHIMTAEAGEAISAGDKVGAAADGQIIVADAAAAGDYNIGIALQAASGADVRIRIFFWPHANY